MSSSSGSSGIVSVKLSVLCTCYSFNGSGGSSSSNSSSSFLECGGIDHEQAKVNITKEFLRHLKIVWKSLLYRRFKVQATNSSCIHLLSYGFGVVGWTKSEICKIVHQVMTSHHPRSAIERLFLSRKFGGKGLLCVENLLNHRLIMLSHHLEMHW